MLRPILKSLIGVTASLVLWWTPVHAQTAEQAAAFEQVIRAQVDAFKRDAWDQAFSYASPGIRQIFGTSERFRAMVLSGYEAVARPQVFEFEDATEINGRLTQPAYVVGPDGLSVRAYYVMEQQPDGSWKIDGVYMEKLAGRTS